MKIIGQFPVSVGSRRKGTNHHMERPVLQRFHKWTRQMPQPTLDAVAADGVSHRRGHHEPDKCWTIARPCMHHHRAAPGTDATSYGKAKILTIAHAVGSAEHGVISQRASRGPCDDGSR